MLKRSSRIGLIGAVAIGASALALWACTPAPVAGGNPNNNNVVTPVAQKGQVKVALQLPSDSRQTQSILDALNSVDLSVTGAAWSPALTATFAKADLASNTASKTFSDVPAGAATVAAVAKDAAGTALATASANVTVQTDQTANATLTLVFKEGDISAVIDIIVKSPVTIGEHGASQSAATYVGQAVCGSCHTDIQSSFKDTKHFKGIVNSATGEIRYPAKGRPSCAACHATGTYAADYGTAIPYDYTTASATESPNTLVSTITCEACHGPGSKHIVAKYADRFQTITRKPDYSVTCAKCHTGYSKKYDSAGKPVYESGSTSYQVYEPANFPATGAPEAVYMAGGSHNALGMGPVSSVYNQYGGVHLTLNASGSYDAGAQVSFTNAHKTNTANGCVTCHMANSGAAKHSFLITEETSDSTVTNACQKCHGVGFTGDSIKSFQGQTKMAIGSLKNALIDYRKAFCTETVKKTYSGISDKSTASVGIEDISRAPSMWDDTPGFVTAATASLTTIWIDKGNWSGQDPTSPHQKLYNQAYWNYSVANGELSYGIHAPTYTQYLLRSSYNALGAELKAKGVTGWTGFSALSLK